VSQRIETLACFLDKCDPDWVIEIDLDDDEAVLVQLLWWVCVEPQKPYDYADEVLALAVAEREVFTRWGERDWRRVVAERQEMEDLERFVRASFLAVGHQSQGGHDRKRLPDVWRS
jgi:hypothetical protein